MGSGGDDEPGWRWFAADTVLLKMNDVQERGVVDEGESWRLGGLQIPKAGLSYREGADWARSLTGACRLRIEPFEHGLAVLFTDGGADRFTAWAPADRSDDLDRWVGFIRDEIADRLAVG